MLREEKNNVPQWVEENIVEEKMKIAVMISSGLNAHMLNRGEQIQGLHVNGQ